MNFQVHRSIANLKTLISTEINYKYLNFCVDKEQFVSIQKIYVFQSLQQINILSKTKFFQGM